MTTMKIERLINLMAFLLETTKPIPAEKIRSTIHGYDSSTKEAFQRMFERDKEELREMGISIEYVPLDAWEEEFGYIIPKERYYLPEMNLSPEEAAALSLAAGILRASDPKAAQSVAIRLGEEADLESLDWVSASLGLDTSGLEVAFESVSERRTLVFDYPGRDTAPGRRTVDPYGLAHRHGAWYLIGLDHDREGIRSFRLNRVLGDLRAVHPRTSGQYEVPKDFRPAGFLDRPPFTVGEGGTTAIVRFESDTAWLARRLSPWLEFAEDESARVNVVDQEGFFSWLLSFGEGAELLSPQELRTGLRRRLDEIYG